MLNALQQFFYMGGHGVYVFSAYAIVCFALGLQWLLPWRRFKHYLRQLSHEQNS